MNRKRARSPSASAHESTTKTCLIFDATILGDVKDYVYAIILDPYLQTADADPTITTDEDGFILNAQPTVRFDGLGGMVFCVFKSILYIIESNDRSPEDIFYQDMMNAELRRRDEKAKRDIIATISVTKSVYTFDLGQADSSSEMVVVQKSELQKLPDMLGAKIDATALVTPRGKILVYSKHITPDFAYLSNLSEFELYDPDTQVWIELPRLYDPPPPSTYVKLLINGSGFVSSSVFLVSTSNGNYAIDLEENEKCWKKYGLQNEIMDFNFFGEEGVCVTEDFHVKSTKDWGSLCEFPNLSRIPSPIIYSIIRANQFVHVTRLIALMDNVDGGGCFSFCGVQILYRSEGGMAIPFFILDVFRVNKLIISHERCLKFSPRLRNVTLLFTSGFFSVQFST